MSFLRIAAIPTVLMLAACQPSLDSDLPRGAAAADLLRVTPQQLNPASYAIQPGDVLSVDVFRETDLSLERVVVDQSGQFAMPLIGTIQATGQTPALLAARIEQSYGARYLRDPQVTVQVLQSAQQIVSVEGSVENPGVYEVRPGYTLLSAMALAGSPDRSAKLDEVLIFRQIDGQRAGARFDLTDIRAGRAPDPQLLPGDSIVVGYDSLRGGFEDFLRAAPIFNVFTAF